MKGSGYKDEGNKKIEYKLKYEKTEHIEKREKRLKEYKDFLSTNFIDCFVVNNYHPGGLEVHCINEHGLIYIYNYETGRFITVLHPRPQQLKRYYIKLGIQIPSKIQELASECFKRNKKRKLNKK